MRKSINIQFNALLKWTALIAIQAILLIGSADCFGRYDAAKHNKIDVNTLAPELNISRLDLQNQFLFEGHNFEETILASKLSQNIINGKEADEQKQLGFWGRFMSQINIWIKRKRADFYLLLILKVNNPIIRRKACKDLIALEDERVFRLLRLMGFSRDADLNGKFRERAEKALLQMHNHNPILSEKLGFKKTLFEIALSNRLSARSRAANMLKKIDIRSDEGLEQIIGWLNSESSYLIVQASQQIKKLSKRKLEKIRQKHAVAYLLKAASKISMTEPIFAAIIDVMNKLQADELQIERAARSCFFNANNAPGARKKAAIIMAKVSSNHKRTLRILARFGLQDKYAAVRLGSIEAIAQLGEIKGIKKLKTHRKNITTRGDETKKEMGSHYFDYRKELACIEDAIAQLEMPHILGLYDEVTKDHVVNVYELAKIVAQVIGLDSEDKKILGNVALKHDLGKSMQRYYSTVVIPAKYKPGDIDLETFRTEHSFQSDYLVEKYDIDTSRMEHLIIRNHHRPDILLEDPDFTDLSHSQRKRVVRLLEVMMVLDWLCGRTEISRPPNWFDYIELKQTDVEREIKARYCDTLNYEFSIDVQALVGQIFSLKPAMRILNNNMTHNPKLIAHAMKSWTGDLDFYLNVLRCRILSLESKDIQGAKNFIDRLAEPLFEEALLADAKEQDYIRAKEILTETVDAFLSNQEIAGSIEKYLKKTAKNNYQTLFFSVMQSFYGYKLSQDSELIPWGVYFERSFTLKKGARVRMKALDEETAKQYANEIIALQNHNHPKSKISKEDLLGEYIYDGKQRRKTLALWEHSLIAFNEKGKVVGFAINYERSKNEYPECLDVQDSLYMHIVDVDEEYQNKGLATLLITNSIAKFVNSGFKVLKKTDDAFITIQTREDNHPMRTVLERKIGFEFAGVKFYSQRKVDAIYALALTQKKATDEKRKGYMPDIIKRQSLADRAFINALRQAI